MKNSRLLITIIALSVTSQACVSARSDSVPSSVAKKSQENSDKKTAQSDSPDFLHAGFFDNNKQALEAWQSFTKNGKYRIATRDDFSFSQTAIDALKKSFGNTWDSRISYPAIVGMIARHAGTSKDLAVIVVDSERSDPNRFGLVVFNVDKNEKTASIHWLLQGRNLSTSILSWHSNWPVIVFYDKDGNVDPYYMNWDQRDQRYSLGKEQKGPDAREGSRLK